MTVQKNLEEEVQLRLQFETNLNKLNGMYRDLEIVHKRAQA
jgi:hypothetical protein